MCSIFHFLPTLGNFYQKANSQAGAAKIRNKINIIKIKQSEKYSGVIKLWYVWAIYSLRRLANKTHYIVQCKIEQWCVGKNLCKLFIHCSMCSAKNRAYIIMTNNTSFKCRFRSLVLFMCDCATNFKLT